MDNFEKLLASVKGIRCHGYRSLDRDPHRWAAKKDCYVVVPRDDQLQIDIDNEEAYEYFRERLKSLVTDFKRKGVLGKRGVFYDWWASKSGLPNRHIVVTVPDYSFEKMERIAFQFALGSDPVRETLNFRRVFAGTDPIPVVLFRPSNSIAERVMI